MRSAHFAAFHTQATGLTGLQRKAEGVWFRSAVAAGADADHVPPLGFVAALGCLCLCLCLCCRRGRRPLPNELDVRKGVASGGCHSRVDSTAGFDSFEQIELST